MIDLMRSRRDEEKKNGGKSSRGDSEIAENTSNVDEVTGIIIDEAMKIHKGLGPGLLESVYEMVLAKRLKERGLHVQCQRVVSFEYDGIFFDEGFRCDMLVDHRVVIELKSVESIHPVHKKQILTYLRLMKLNVGLLINFGAPILKEGLHRIVNNYTSSTDSASPRLRVIKGLPC